MKNEAGVRARGRERTDTQKSGCGKRRLKIFRHVAIALRGVSPFVLIFFPLFTGAFLFLSVSCTTYAPDEGNLVLDVESSEWSGSFGSKTLLPGVKMVPASYDFAGVGPKGKTFTLNSVALPSRIEKLVFGDWTVSVNVKNSDGLVIALGQTVVTVVSGESKSVNVPAKPVDGYGTLDLTVLWTASDVQIPSITASLVPFNGSPIPLNFTLGTGTATFRNESIPTGYHTLTLQLNDNGEPVTGAVESVRIVDKGTTSGTFELYKVNKPGGSISVGVSPVMNDPLVVTMSGQVQELQAGGTMTVQAAVSGAPGAVVFSWYLNGGLKATGPTFTFGSDLPAGSYRLDVMCFTEDGKRSGSTTHQFTVVEPAQVTLEWDPNGEADLDGYKLHIGNQSGSYTSSVDVGNATTYTLTGLTKGKTYYIAATAYNTGNIESGFSNEVVFAAN